MNEKVSIESLSFPERNVRQHPEKQMEELARGLQTFGQTRPVVVDENGLILVGAGMVTAMQRLKWSEAYAIVKRGLSEAEKKKLMVVDNRMFDLGVDDADAVVRFLSEMPDTDVPGFDEETISNLVASDEDIDARIEGYGAPSDPPSGGGGGGDFTESMPTPPSAPSEQAPPAARQVQCPHCGEWVWDG